MKIILKIFKYKYIYIIRKIKSHNNTKKKKKKKKKKEKKKKKSSLIYR